MVTTRTAIIEDLRNALDRVAFARSLGFEPDGWQLEALRTTSKRVLFNISRQAGKSTVASLLALHEAVHFPRYAEGGCGGYGLRPFLGLIVTKLDLIVTKTVTKIALERLQLAHAST